MSRRISGRVRTARATFAATRVPSAAMSAGPRWPTRSMPSTIVTAPQRPRAGYCGRVIASGVQGGRLPASAGQTVLLLVLMALMAAALWLLLRRHARPPAQPVSEQWRALAVMGELCPHGWEAQITLRGWGAPVPDDAPSSRAPMVELEWREYAEGGERVAVTRRVWAPTVGQALQAMVDGRRTDLVLEQIERSAAEDGGGGAA